VSITTKTYTAIRREVESTPAGGKLPTVRELMERLGATQFAVQSALKALKDEGVVNTQVGRGSFVSGPVQQESSPVQKESVIKLPKQQKLSVLLMTHAMQSGRGDRVAAAIYDDLVRAGHSVLSITYNDLSSIETVLVNNSFDLCLLQPRRSVLPTSVLASLKKCSKNIIVEGRVLEKMDVDIIYRDRLESIKLACNHLRQLGHSSIGLITESNPEKVGYRDVERIFSFYCDAAEIEKAPIIKSMAYTEETQEDCYQMLADKLLEHKAIYGELPTAFVVSGHYSGLSIINTFKCLNMNIPTEISIVRIRASGDLDVAGGFFTSVSRSPEQIAQSIHKMIDWRLANPLSPPTVHLDKPKLKANKSSIKQQLNRNKSSIPEQLNNNK